MPLPEYTLLKIMRKDFLRLLICLSFLMAVPGLSGQSLRESRFVERARQGFTDIFNMDYDRAQQVFAALAREYPNHPAPPLYEASILWLEEMLRRQDLSMNRFIAPGYFSGKTGHVMLPKDRAAFLDYLQKSQELSKAILDTNRNDPDARYFLATAQGLRASFAITIDHSLRDAFRNGNRAFASLKKLVEERPDYYDAYLAVGIYEYIVGSIPWYLKWMAYFVGARGTREAGMEHVGLAAERGQYVRNESRLVLMVLDVRQRRFPQALEHARSLSARFPRSFLLAMNVAQTLRLSGRKEEASEALLEIERRVEAKEPNFDKLPLQNFRFDMAVELMSMSQLDPAEERFRRCIEDPLTSTKHKALSHLRLGRILEWKHRPAEAVREYRSVLAMEDFEGSRSQARRWLKKVEGGKED